MVKDAAIPWYQISHDQDNVSFLGLDQISCAMYCYH